MQHNRRVFLAVLPNVCGAETRRHVQIDLMRSALPVAADGISQNELQLGTVKSAFTGIVGVFQPRCFERLFQCCLGLVPDFIVANTIGWPVRELDQYVIETEIAIDAEYQIAYCDRLIRNLFRCAEDMRVVLRKCTHPQHPMQCA